MAIDNVNQPTASWQAGYKKIINQLSLVNEALAAYKSEVQEYLGDMPHPIAEELCRLNLKLYAAQGDVTYYLHSLEDIYQQQINPPLDIKRGQ